MTTLPMPHACPSPAPLQPPLLGVGPPVIRGRMAMRLMLECYVDICRLLIRHFGGSIDSGVIFLMLLHNDRRLRRVNHCSASAPMSISAIAASLDKPFETVRRKINAMAEQGICKRLPSGIVICPDGLARPEQALIVDAIHDIFVRLIVDLAFFDMVPAVSPGVALDPQADVIDLVSDLFLLAKELGTDVHGDWMQMLVFCAVMTANARRITHDEVLAQLYAENSAPPPIHVREPVSAKAIARALHIPYPTMRRHIGTLIASGRLQWRQRGLFISPEWHQAPALLLLSERLQRRLNQHLATLAEAGFPLANAETAYRDARPPLPKFD